MLIGLFCVVQVSVAGTGHTLHFATLIANLDAVCTAFEIFIVIAGRNLTGTYTGGTMTAGVGGVLEVGVAARIVAISDGNGTGMATAVGIVGALGYGALGDFRHVGGDNHLGPHT